MTRVVLISIFCLLQVLGTSLAQNKNVSMLYTKFEADMDGTKYEKSKLNVTENLEIRFTNMNQYKNYDVYVTQGDKNLTIGTDLKKSDVSLKFNDNPDYLDLTMKAEPVRAGPYQLIFLNKDNGKSFNETFEVFSPPFVQKFTKSKRVLERDPMSIECVVYGWPTPVITWSSDLVDTDKGFNMVRNVTANTTKLVGDTLAFESMKFSDGGLYRCNATNVNGFDVSIVKVRVKDRLAALWPFIGIIIEVAILVTIILVYERRRANSKKNMADEDNQPMTDTKEKDANDKSEDIRQRNVKV